MAKVKGNQPNLLKAIKQTVENTTALESHVRKEKSRGKSEIRTTTIFAVQDNIPQGWPAINRIVLVNREFTSRNKIHRTVSYYITDLETNAQHMGSGVRGHWGIENKLHYTKDVIMREDKTCTKNKNAASNLALFRDFAFNFLKSKQKSIKYATEFFANNNIKELYNILTRT